MLTNITILQILGFAIIGASMRAVWDDTPEEVMTPKLFIKKLTMPVTITVGGLLVGEGHIFIDYTKVYQLWGAALLLSFCGIEVFTFALNWVKQKLGIETTPTVDRQNNEDNKGDEDKDQPQ